ncbi:MAG: hypothetical protein C5B51_00960 [Terriglobia bacterium]|nr:MAG: hypothetical protein C5B51_00960 [Terriglobia bacterium]
MIKTLLLGLVLAAIPALGHDGAGSIQLYIDFHQIPPDAVVNSVRNELARIMSPMGLVFNWSLLAENRGNGLSARLAVVRFKGQCDAANLTALNSRSGVLGWTYMTDGVIQPFTDIDCDSIRAFLGGDLATGPKEDHERTYGRAVGRVLAHELYHIFVKTARHSSRGVAKPYYSVQELLSRDFQFEQKECDELRRYWSDLVTTGF